MLPFIKNLLVPKNMNSVILQSYEAGIIMQFCIEENQVMETGSDLPETIHNRDGLEFMPLASEALTLCSSPFLSKYSRTQNSTNPSNFSTNYSPHSPNGMWTLFYKVHKLFCTGHWHNQLCDLGKWRVRGRDQGRRCKQSDHILLRWLTTAVFLL